MVIARLIGADERKLPVDVFIYPLTGSCQLNTEGFFDIASNCFEVRSFFGI